MKRISDLDCERVSFQDNTNPGNGINFDSMESEDEQFHFKTFQEMFPTLKKEVLFDILRSNDYDLLLSTDAALEINSSRDIQGKLIAKISAKYKSGKQNSANSVVLLEENFLICPKFRLVINSTDQTQTNFSIIFRKEKEKVGITIHLMGKQIFIHGVINGSLAMKANVKENDILIGINQIFFDANVDINYILELLKTSENVVTLHFIRKTKLDKKYIIHKFANILFDQKIISGENLQLVSSMLNRLKDRVLNWDQGLTTEKVYNEKNENFKKSSMGRLFPSTQDDCNVLNLLDEEAASSNTSMSPTRQERRKSVASFFDSETRKKIYNNSRNEGSNKSSSYISSR